MKKYEVEIEVLYVYGVEAENESAATMVAEMNVSSHATPLEWKIASIYAEELEEGAVPTERAPKSADELARRTGTDAPSLYRLMRTLASLGILTEDATRRLT